MGLLSLIKENESSTFISLKEAINLLTKETGSTIQEVAIYFLNKDVSSELACHVKGSDYKIKETSGKHFSYGVFRPYGENWAFSYLTHISERHNCTTWDELETYSAGQWDDWGTAFPCGNVKLIENTYWYREAFFNLEPIKSLNLFDERLTKINPNLIPIWDINYVHIQELESLSYSELLNDNFPDQNLQTIINENESFLEFWDHEKQTKKFPLFYKNDTFTAQEAACLIAGYEPSIVQYNSRKVEWLNNNPSYHEAKNLIYASVRAGLFEEITSDIFIIKSADLKTLLLEKEIYIDGFNNSPKERRLSYDQLLENNEKLSKALKQEESQSSLLVSDYHSSQNEIERLKDLINKKDAEIERLNEQVISESLESFLYQAERDNLGFEVAELKERIKNLESSQQIEQANNLLDAIFDETMSERYAPDLALSIRLWEDLYINNRRSDSHSNKANNWIKTNTGYSGTDKDPSTSRIREIASPFKEWGAKRDKNHKNN